MTFTWDEAKNLANYEKHGVWFEEAQSIWADPLSSEFFDDAYDDGEQRYLRIGRSGGHRVLLVVFCERHDEVVRLISARRATAHERKAHEEGL